MCFDPRPDVVYLDLMMAPVDGLELTRQIRRGEDGVYRFTPIIMVTADASIKQVTAARDAGVNEFLAKPFSATLVYYRLRALIEKPRGYISGMQFFGPDRRRRDTALSGIERRAHHDVNTTDASSSHRATPR